MALNYIVLSTGRARSGVLTKYLAQLGVGDPNEYYEKLRFDLHKCSTEPEVKEWLSQKRKNDILGMRMVGSHIRCMHNRLGIRLKEFINTYLPNAVYIHQTRDPVRQAIESQLCCIDRGKQEAFCKEILKKRVCQIVISNAAYEAYFKKHQITPILINAFDLEENPIPTVQNVLDGLGLDIKADRIRPEFTDKYMSKEGNRIYETLFKRYQ